ncbi:MAG TPA: hypothetical protein VEB66_11810 [Opitutaceae bacterium]|nr:hypothetical protein [Opitutaceae bacterium]
MNRVAAKHLGRARPGGRGIVPVLLAAALLMAGCASPRTLLSRRAAAGDYAPANVAAEPALPADLRRVAVLPVHGPGESERAAIALDPVVAVALQRQARFEVVTVSRADCRRWFGAPSFASTGALPHDLLAEIARRHQADAVLFVDLTAERSYRPLLLGLRAKLATARDTRIVWAVDEIVSADQPAVAAGMSRAAASTKGSVSATILDSIQSPSRFAAYVSDALFRTLPPR